MPAPLNSLRYWPIFILMVACPGWTFAGTGDSPDVVYHSHVGEVRLAFSATDEKQHIVANVNPDDFAVIDDGMVIRDFRSLMRSGDTPLDIVVLVDASESVASRFRAMMQDVVRLIARQSQTPADALSVIGFSGTQTVVLCTGDCRSAAAEQRLVNLKPAGTTPLFDALAYTARFLSGRHNPGIQPVILLLSDGHDTVSAASSRDAIDAVLASGALLYAINPDPAESSSSPAFAQLAESTGGRSFSAHDSGVNVFEAVTADLRASYLVTYSVPSRAPGFHSLRILPKHNLNLRFHCRSGYYYEKDNQ